MPKEDGLADQEIAVILGHGSAVVMDQVYAWLSACIGRWRSTTEPPAGDDHGHAAWTSTPLSPPTSPVTTLTRANTRAESHPATMQEEGMVYWSLAGADGRHSDALYPP